MTKKDKQMLFSMLCKIAKDLREHNIREFCHGWDEFEEEHKYFETRLKYITAEIESDAIAEFESM